MTTPPDKCPKCGDKRTPYDHGLMVWPFACDSYTDSHGTFKQSPWCVDRERANHEHERAEKWKACSVGFAEWFYAAKKGDCSPPLSGSLAKFEALMKEES